MATIRWLDKVPNVPDVFQKGTRRIHIDWCSQTNRPQMMPIWLLYIQTIGSEEESNKA